MDGFIAKPRQRPKDCLNADQSALHELGRARRDGLPHAREIPNYWTYAQQFVLQDHMFEPNARGACPRTCSWCRPGRRTAPATTPASCTQSPYRTGRAAGLHRGQPRASDTDLCLDRPDLSAAQADVSWGYYVIEGDEPDCQDDDAMPARPVTQNTTTPGIWNPLPYFDTVKHDGQLGNIQTVDNFYTRRQDRHPAGGLLGRPDGEVSEHPPAPISAGQAYVTSLINAVMQGPGLEQHRHLPVLGRLGRLLRPRRPADGGRERLRPAGARPGHQPVRRQGYIDHQTLSFDAYVKFIEDDFLSGQRLDPTTDGRPDPRPTVRENVPILGDLTQTSTSHKHRGRRYSSRSIRRRP